MEKITFITPHGLYYYNVMSVGLKNVRATYQRMVTKIFRPLIGKSMEVYIDDMLVESKEHPDHTRHLQETFELLRRHGMKLNPLKCVFGVSSGKFLGFMVTQRGIEANLIQLKAIMNSQSPASQKRVQKLTSRLMALKRFISLFTYGLKLFFATLKGAQQACWNQECNQALTTIKQFLTEPLVLASPKAEDTLYLYLLVSKISVSATLFKENENQK